MRARHRPAADPWDFATAVGSPTRSRLMLAARHPSAPGPRSDPLATRIGDSSKSLPGGSVYAARWLSTRCRGGPRLLACSDGGRRQARSAIRSAKAVAISFVDRHPRRPGRPRDLHSLTAAPNGSGRPGVTASVRLGRAETPERPARPAVAFAVGGGAGRSSAMSTHGFEQARRSSPIV